jgi:hypothetical protein
MLEKGSQKYYNLIPRFAKRNDQPVIHSSTMVRKERDVLNDIRQCKVNLL